MTLLFRDPLFQLHDTGYHPENAGRLRAIDAMLDQTGMAARCVTGRYEPIALEAFVGIHDAGMIERARQVAEQGGGYLDPDTVVSPESYRVALAAAGACVAAVDAVLRGPDRTAICLVRPPGHHALSSRSMGFCLFNNIALSAHQALTTHQLDRILVVDWDVHHGNGTQDIWYRSERVFFFSMHRYGGGFYPGTGAADENGGGPGLGWTLNLPVPFNTTRQEYLGGFKVALANAADKARPQLVLISAGFDAHRVDPVGSLCLETEDFGTMTKHVLEVANVHCQGRVVSCLEGGYNPGALANSVRAHLEALLQSKPLTA